MSIILNYFKDWRFDVIDEPWLAQTSVVYLDNDTTSHSAGDVRIVQDLLEKYGGRRIPTIPFCYYGSVDEPQLNLIEPEDMAEMCRNVLDSSEVDTVDMRNRFEWFCELSKQGYYLAYEGE